MDNEQVRIQKLLSRVPFLSEENCREILPYSTYESNIAYYSDLQRCAELLKNKYNGEVNGLWFIRVPAVDGGVQTIVRTRSKLPTLKGLELSADLTAYPLRNGWRTNRYLRYLMTKDKE